MNVTIVGAGNMGLAMTAYMAVNEKAAVTLFTGKNIDSLRLETVEQSKVQYTDRFRATDDPEAAFSEADMIFVTYPAFLRKNRYLQTGGSNHIISPNGGFIWYVKPDNRGVKRHGITPT